LEQEFLYVDISSIDTSAKRIVAPKRLLGRDAPSRARQEIRTNDVLVATTRPNLNAVALVPPELDGQIASTGFCVLRPADVLDARYLFRFVQTVEFVRSLSDLVKGALYPAVTDRQVREQWLPAPTLSEQRRIAAKLEGQMATIERARAAAAMQLSAAQALPAAYLRAIFTSREAQRWPRRALGDISEIVSGITLGRQPRGSLAGSVPYLRVANVKDGYLDLFDVYEIEATEAEIGRLRLRSGDLLLTEGGDLDKLGRGTVWRDELPECLHQNHIFRVRFDLNQFLPDFVSAQIGSHYGKGYFLAHGKRTTGIATINQRVLAAFPLMAPDRAEQERIVNTLHAQQVRAERMNHALGARLTEIGAMSGVLLRRAFSGDL
jgi:type I restriction enzyme S subunit